MPAYTGPNAIPVIVHHEIDGPLESDYFEALGRFIFAFSSAERDLGDALRQFIAKRSGGEHSSEIVNICTKGAPIKPLMDMAESVWHRLCAPNDDACNALSRARAQFTLVQELRNVLAHEPLYPDHFTEEPQAAAFKYITDKKSTSGKMIRVTLSDLRAAAEDAGDAAYLYSCILTDSSATLSVEMQKPWQYTKSEATRARPQSPPRKAK
ncbi:hypothetical protein [Pseudogemmobacter sonorensis]|uniref:hypothetical protein n=1 Tax=Pseudogemmobacter sonorensis TaxID=2989681 RepID=UPI0036CF4A95